jgi:hypothetical protein
MLTTETKTNFRRTSRYVYHIYKGTFVQIKVSSFYENLFDGSIDRCIKDIFAKMKNYTTIGFGEMPNIVSFIFFDIFVTTGGKEENTNLSKEYFFDAEVFTRDELMLSKNPFRFEAVKSMDDKNWERVIISPLGPYKRYEEEKMIVIRRL